MAREQAHRAQVWAKADEGGGPAALQPTWISAFGPDRYASLDATIAGAEIRCRRAAELTDEITRLTEDAAALRSKLAKDERALERIADPDLRARTSQVFDFLGGLLGHDATEGQQRAARIGARAAERRALLHAHEDRLSHATDELIHLGTPHADLRAAAREKAEHVVTHRGEGWAAVGELMREEAQLAERAEELRAAHEALQRVITAAAAASNRYATVRIEFATRWDDGQARLEAAVEEATVATRELREAVGQARSALHRLDLPRRLRLRKPRRLTLRWIPGPFVAPTEAELSTWSRETQRLSRQATAARSAVRSAWERTSRASEQAEARLVGLMRRPF